MTKSLNERFVGSHVQKAHATMRGEHQLAEYVAQLDLKECVEILSAVDEELPSLAARHPECRVLQNERRGFDEVVRSWTLYVLSKAEGG